MALGGEAGAGPQGRADGRQSAIRGAGAAVLGSPLNALVWLANTVLPLGITLAAGSVILPGALTAAVPLAPGKSVTATFAGIGSVTAHFTAGKSA